MKCSAITKMCPDGTVGIALFVALLIGALVDFLVRLP